MPVFAVTTIQRQISSRNRKLGRLGFVIPSKKFSERRFGTQTSPEKRIDTSHTLVVFLAFRLASQASDVGSIPIARSINTLTLDSNTSTYTR